ncbi:hypothetical protein QJQ45_004891 [Haematococcus lacustris]|nr:hypothetical protein QJQ45_004891 [Haematococcus lacustris]
MAPGPWLRAAHIPPRCAYSVKKNKMKVKTTRKSQRASREELPAGARPAPTTYRRCKGPPSPPNPDPCPESVPNFGNDLRYRSTFINSIDLQLLIAQVRLQEVASRKQLIAVNASTLIKLQFTFFGLDLYSLVTWESSMEALVAAQPSSVTMQSLAAPGTCYSHLKALNTSALLNTSLTAQQLMPGLDLFVSDVARVLHSYLQESSVLVQAADFCAGPRTESTFYTYLPTTLHTGPWPTLLVSVHLLPQDLAWLVGAKEGGWHPARWLWAHRGALMTRGSQFFVFYQMPFQRCFAQLLLQPAAPPS